MKKASETASRSALKRRRGRSDLLPPHGTLRRDCEPEALRLEMAMFNAMAAIAAVLEEPHCSVGAAELKSLVYAHRALSRLVGFGQGDYALRDGACVARWGGALIKTPAASGVLV